MKATFLTYLSLGDHHTMLVNPPWNRRRKCSPHFTSEKQALKFITGVGRAWKKDGYKTIKVGILRIDAELPPFNGDWSVLKRNGVKEIKL